LFFYRGEAGEAHPGENVFRQIVHLLVDAYQFLTGFFFYPKFPYCF
jgi:hypothetical protein